MALRIVVQNSILSTSAFRRFGTSHRLLFNIKPRPVSIDTFRPNTQDGSQSNKPDHQFSSIKTLIASTLKLKPHEEKSFDKLAKKCGWIISGSAISLIAAFYGQMYLLSAVIPIVLFNRNDILMINRTYKRDALFLQRFGKCWLMRKRIQNDNLILPKVLKEMVAKHPDKVMLQMADKQWKYKDVQNYANRTARLMQTYGFQKGDVIALFCNNSPEMIAVILGLSNLGIITALINASLRNEELTAAIKNTKCSAIIFDDELLHAFDDVCANFGKVCIFQMGLKASKPEFVALDREIVKESSDFPENFKKLNHQDPLLLIQSDNGNTTQPQIITHEKFLLQAWTTTFMLNLKPGVKIYNPTPLHNFNGLILGVGPSMIQPVTNVLRVKFSSKDFFRECFVNNCTVAQYAGNMCKHLLLNPVSPIENFHPVKIMYGSGMENDYWQEFVHRFRTPVYEMLESDSNEANLMNLEGKIGVVGFRPKIIPSLLFPHYVIRVFGKERIPVRNEDGSCQLCNYDEPGLLVRMWDQRPLPKGTCLIGHVFKKNDIAISHGEILTMDSELYLRPINKYEGRTWMTNLMAVDEVERLVSILTNRKCVSYTLDNIRVLTIEDPNAIVMVDKIGVELKEYLPNQRLPHYIRFVNKLETMRDGEVNKEVAMKEGLYSETSTTYYFDKLSSTYREFIQTSKIPTKSCIAVKETIVKSKENTIVDNKKPNEELSKLAAPMTFTDAWKGKQAREEEKFTKQSPKSSNEKVWDVKEVQNNLSVPMPSTFEAIVSVPLKPIDHEKFAQKLTSTNPEVSEVDVKTEEIKPMSIFSYSQSPAINPTRVEKALALPLQKYKDVEGLRAADIKIDEKTMQVIDKSKDCDASLSELTKQVIVTPVIDDEQRSSAKKDEECVDSNKTIPEKQKMNTAKIEEPKVP